MSRNPTSACNKGTPGSHDIGHVQDRPALPSDWWSLGPPGHPCRGSRHDRPGLAGLITASPLVRVPEAIAALATAAAVAYMAVRIIQRIDRVGHHLHTLRFGATLPGPIGVV
jgi:hypothetical protein